MKRAPKPESDRARAVFALVIGAIALGHGLFLAWHTSGDFQGTLGLQWTAPALGLAIASVLAAFISRPKKLVLLAVGAWALGAALGLIAVVLAAFEPSLRGVVLAQGTITCGTLSMLVAVVRWVSSIAARSLPPPVLDGKHKLEVTRSNENKPVKRHASEIHAGDVLELEPRSTVPVDGTITRGEGFADESAITGSDVPQVKHAGDMVFAGSVAQIPELMMRASSDFESSVISRRDRHLAELVAAVEKDRRGPQIAAGIIISAALLGGVLVIVLRDRAHWAWMPAVIGLLYAAASAAPLLAIRIGKARLVALAAARGLLPSRLEDVVALAHVRRWQVDPRLLSQSGAVEAITYGDIEPARLIGLAHALLEDTAGPERSALEAEITRRSLSPPRPAALKRDAGLWHGTVAGERWIMGPPQILSEAEDLKIDPAIDGPIQFLREKQAIVWLLARRKEIVGAIGIKLEIDPDVREVSRTLQASIMPGLPDGTRQALADAAGVKRDGPPLKTKDATLASPESPPPSAGLVVRVQELRPKLPLGRDQGSVLLAPSVATLPATLDALKKKWRATLGVAVLASALPLLIALPLAYFGLLYPLAGAALGAAGLLLAARAGR